VTTDRCAVGAVVDDGETWIAASGARGGRRHRRSPKSSCGWRHHGTAAVAEGGADGSRPQASPVV
jgi:hypothetical protein